MIELGKIQELEVVSMAPVGVYLNSRDKKAPDNILLPLKQVPQNTKLGDIIEVFVYRDSKDRLIYTTRRPKIILGEIASLKVVDLAKIGAFLDWGLEKDLLLPFKEQVGKIQEGREYLVALYIDKTERLCATMDIYKYLSSQPPYKQEEKVKGIIYSIKPEWGAFVAVEGKYHGLLPQKEMFESYRIGDEIEARITNVRADGKLDLSVREKAYKQMDADSQIVLDKLHQNNGRLLLNDQSSPDEIKDVLSMSKRAFKRAVGRLMKEGKIEITDEGIKMLSE